MNGVFELRSRRSIETIGSESSLRGAMVGWNTCGRAITIEVETQWKNGRVIREVHQRETTTVKGRLSDPCNSWTAGILSRWYEHNRVGSARTLSERLKG